MTKILNYQIKQITKDRFAVYKRLHFLWLFEMWFIEEYVDSYYQHSFPVYRSFFDSFEEASDYILDQLLQTTYKIPSTNVTIPSKSRISRVGR